MGILLDACLNFWDKRQVTLNQQYEKRTEFHCRYCISIDVHFPEVSNGLAQGTAFTYQGCLNNAGSPASGSYDFTFTLFSGNSTSSSQIGITQTNLALAVSNGLFTATLDFGTVFTGTPAWLAIGVRGMGESDFTILNPLQPVVYRRPVYAIYAPNAGAAASVATNGVVPLSALPFGVVTNNAIAVNISGLLEARLPAMARH